MKNDTTTTPPVRLTIMDDILPDSISMECIAEMGYVGDKENLTADVNILVHDDCLNDEHGEEYVNLTISSNPVKVRHLARWLNEAADWMEQNMPRPS